MAQICNLIPRGMRVDRPAMREAIRSAIADGQSVYYMRDRGLGRIHLGRAGELVPEIVSYGVEGQR